MNEVVHLLWFAKEMPEGEEDIELLIGVYSSEAEAKAAIERVKNKRGFAEWAFRFAHIRSIATSTEGFTTN
jgi:hypothetical protein